MESLSQTLHKLGVLTSLAAAQQAAAQYAAYAPLATSAGGAWLSATVTAMQAYLKLMRDVAVAAYIVERTLATGYVPAFAGFTEGEEVDLRDLLTVVIESIKSAEAKAGATKLKPTPADKGSLTKHGAAVLTASVKNVRRGYSYEVRGAVEGFESLSGEVAKQQEDWIKSRLIDMGIHFPQQEVKRLERVNITEAARRARLRDIRVRAATRVGNEAGQAAHSALRMESMALGASEVERWAEPRYARVSMTGTPCNFCAMLISRGATYTNVNIDSAGRALVSDKRKQSARVRAGKINRLGQLFHTNDRCTVRKFWSFKEFLNSPGTELNRELYMEWQVVSGLKRLPQFQFPNIDGSMPSNPTENWRNYWRERKKDPKLAGRVRDNYSKVAKKINR